MVSIIVPVYNVEKYVKRCLNSIINQTYQDIEILIMEGKSSDDSLKICIECAWGDDRVVIVSRKDGGLGPARDYGVGIASGDYVLFVDSDDWIPLDFLEKMVPILDTNKDVDLVVADTDNYDEHGIIVSAYRNKQGIEYFYDSDDKKNVLLNTNNSAWGKLYRKSLLLDNHLSQPALPVEDLIIFPSVIAASRGIALCHDTSLCYFIERKDSLMHFQDAYKKIPKIYEYSKQMLEKLDSKKEFIPAFELLMYKRFYGMRNICLGHNWYQERYTKYRETYEFDKEKFGKFLKSRKWVYGGYALRWIAHSMLNDKEGVVEHCTFTSVIAQMTKGEHKIHIEHNNEVRKKSIERDIKGYLQNIMELQTEVDCILIDFVQECTNVLQLSDGNYITDTEGLEESDFDYSNVVKSLDFKSDEYFDLWEEKCKEFISKINSLASDKKIFLIQNYYVQYFYDGHEMRRYEENNQEKNEVLKKMYSYFEEHCSQAIVISPEDELMYTEMLFRPYDPAPFYYNEQYYKNMAMKIERILFDV